MNSKVNLALTISNFVVLLCVYFHLKVSAEFEASKFYRLNDTMVLSWLCHKVRIQLNIIIIVFSLEFFP